MLEVVYSAFSRVPRVDMEGVFLPVNHFRVGFVHDLCYGDSVMLTPHE